ncbi:ArgE/DapE family deacylase [Bombilactobacillus bombi]|uniref:ArgE/DapE family deacylase n=1 Tax=Bombilactobacillus bombi TaxID=1303590 RepID=UPI0015E617D4|nr:ArgE/DapE family deacylase [Bombilactobacillus bombi]MBA1434754.1 ArgE/DapE family deacylase [Bombilactobacillus bombi]
MNEAEKIDILSKLVSFKSVNDHEKQVAEYLQSLFKKHGIESHLVPVNGDRANLVAEIGSGKPILGVSGHMDVVDVQAQNWKTDPFQLTAKDDKLYGRGATDMKSGLAAMVIALIELKQNHEPFKGTIRFMATAGEEVGQEGAEVLQKSGYMKDIDSLLIGEPTGYLTVYASKGELDIDLQSLGKAAHSSMPALGNNAVEHLINVINQIKAQLQKPMADATNSVLGKTIFNVDVIEGGTQPNAIPGHAKAVLNIRTIPELSNQKILDLIQEVLDNYNATTSGKVTMEVGMNIIPILGNKNSKLLKLVQKIGQPYLQKQNYTTDQIKQFEQQAKLSGIPFSADEILAVGVSGGTDASKFFIDQPNNCNYVVFGPGNNNAHQDNEYVSKTMYLDFIEIFKQIITEFFA